MAQELKIRIDDYKQIEKELKNLGALFIEEKIFIDTYFNQPSDHVLKLAKINNKFFLEELKAKNGKFNFVKDQPLSNDESEEIKEQLTKQFGIKRELQGTRKNFQLEDFRITLNLIDDVGEFLILIGENPTEEFITEKLDIKNPDYIRVSFDELQENKSIY